jgi:DNA-binding winged helix-turn-helix (wHTH) protein
MEPEHHIPFGPFCLDVTQGRLWRGDMDIRLRPRSLAVLRYLVAHPGRLVTKAELRGQVWAGTHVTELLRLQNPAVSQAGTCFQQALAAASRPRR